ncbi:MAG: phosphodiester glycosidase family protein [Spirulinaceae cyanobacterium]
MEQLGQHEQEQSMGLRQRPWLRGVVSGMVLIVTLLPLIVYAGFVLRRSPRTAVERELFQGVAYERQVRNQPRPLMIHIVTVDLTVPGVEVVVSPGAALAPAAHNPAVNETAANTTSGFVQAAQVQVATNGSFFYPFREKTPWDYAPRVGDRAKVLGQAIAAGEIYAERRDPWQPLCVLPLPDSASQRLVISPQTTCPVGTAFALSGGPLLLEQGQPARREPVGSEHKPYARLVVAIDQPGTRLWLIAIDGKQPFYSEGMTLPEVTALAQELGADRALNLDGGGSTTLVQATPNQPQLLNAPVHAKIPMLERPVANHLGIRARSHP